MQTVSNERQGKKAETPTNLFSRFIFGWQSTNTPAIFWHDGRFAYPVSTFFPDCMAITYNMAIAIVFSFEKLQWYSFFFTSSGQSRSFAFFSIALPYFDIYSIFLLCFRHAFRKWNWKSERPNDTNIYYIYEMDVCI